MRCRGPCGAAIALPSGLNDGVAIGRRSLDREGALGTALESGDSPHDMEHTFYAWCWRERPSQSIIPRILWCSP